MSLDTRARLDLDGSSLKLETIYGNLDSIQGRTGTRLSVRRVINDGNEEVQISVEVWTAKNGKSGKSRTRTDYGCISLDPKTVDVMVRALTKLQPRYDDPGIPSSHQWAEYRAYWASFYDIVDPNTTARQLLAARQAKAEG